MKKRYTLIIVALFLSSLKGWAQLDIGMQNSQPVVPSWENYELMQYGKIGASMYTGTVNYSIPIYTYKDKEAGGKKIGERYFALKKALEKHKDETCLKALPFNSGYFMSFWCQCNAEELRNYLLDVYQTGIIRSDEHHIRLAFSSVDVCNIEPLVDTVYKAASEMV